MTDSLLVAYGARSVIQELPILNRMMCASDAMGLSGRKVSLSEHPQRQPKSRNFMGLSTGKSPETALGALKTEDTSNTDG